MSQLMAHALGGKVGYHPRGREMGCMDIERLPLAQTEPLLSAPHSVSRRI